MPTSTKTNSECLVFLFVLMSALFLMSCSRKWHTYWQDLTAIPKDTLESRSSGIRHIDFSNPIYCIDTMHINHMPKRQLRVNFHFLNSRDSLHNFREDSGRAFVYRLLRVMQILFDKNDKMRLPSHNDIPVLPPRIQYVLTGRGPGDPGIYFHYDDQLAFYNHMGLRRNNTDYMVADRYGMGIDSIINFFIMPHHPDSLHSRTYQSGCVGIALGNAIKVAGIYEKGLNEWNVRGTFNHEVGHVLGLYHAWSQDGCEDTPDHPNTCWADHTPECKNNVSNNMMDYNAWQSALTPCQLQIIHQNFSNSFHPARKLLIPKWCQFDSTQKILISDTIIWNFERDLEGDIEIEEHGLLHIKSRVSMAPGASIIIRPGGKLILESTTVHNACGLSWKGVQLMSRGKIRGEVVKRGLVTVEHALSWMDSTSIIRTKY